MIAKDHFTELLGTIAALSEEALAEVLEAQTRKISEEAKDKMEEKITLDELFEAAKALGKNKAPGKDGVLMEFYLNMWELMGPILLKLLEDGLANGCLVGDLTEGVLILLAKKGDQLLIGNKRGLTLLNYALKILTKLYQLRLTGILQDFITDQQNAYLPGRSIHRSIMLTNEVLNKMKESGEAFLLLKLDTIKAFDCLG